MKGKTQKVPAWEKNLTMESAGFAYARGSFFTQNWLKPCFVEKFIARLITYR